MAGLSFNGGAECWARKRLCASKTACSKHDDDDDDDDCDGVAFVVGQPLVIFGARTRVTGLGHAAAAADELMLLVR